MKLIFLLFLLLPHSQSWGAQNEVCLNDAISILKKYDPVGFLNYKSLPDSEKENWFTKFIDCSNIPISLAIAVHESTHYLDLTRGTYALSNGKQVPMIPALDKFFAPEDIVPFLNSDDIYVRTYLLGKSSSKNSFLVLLDELNAYTRDTNTSIKLVSLYRKGTTTGTRDALLAIMNFIRLYVYTAEERHPPTWEGFQTKEVTKTMKTIWEQAELALSAACTYPQLATANEENYMKEIFEDSSRSSLLEKLLGRKILKPKNCQK
jgi:hypothetical protein